MDNTDYPIDDVKEYRQEDERDRAVANFEQALSVFGAGIEKKAEQAERDRKPIEDRWVEDLRQFKGLLASSEASNIDSGDSEQTFNITRNKTEGAYSRVGGMLFQTDGNNWGLTATPVAELEENKNRIGAEFAEHPQQQQFNPEIGLVENPVPPPGQVGPLPGQNPSPDSAAQPGSPPVGQVNQPPGNTQQAQNPQTPQLSRQEQQQKEADKKAEAMAKEIKDQLAESDYEVIGRAAIRSACIYGTGVVKGPVIQRQRKNSWKQVEGQQGGHLRVLSAEYSDKAAVEFVPLWDYFPDMSATNRDDCEYEIQRHYMTRKKVFRLLERNDFIQSQVEKLLLSEPNDTPPSYLSQLRQMAGYSTGVEEKQYLVWEFHGTIRAEDLELCGCDTGKTEDGSQLRPDYDAVIWVSNGTVIKAVINPMDTEERPFSIFCYERDDSCIFGEGVPRLILNPQRSVNSCWRKINDNSGLAVGPQTVVDDTIIEPVPINGKISWELTPKKIWRKKNAAKDIRAAFHQFKIDSALPELQGILTMARQFADEETMLPLIAQGEQSDHITQTAHGMEILMNSANDMMRRVVKDWDDNISIPLITRFYDWNMQFSKKEEIKGDMTPEAKGTSALLLKETQAKNLLNLLRFGAATPLATMTKWASVGRELAKAMQLDPDKVFLTDEEAKTLQANQGDDGPDQLEAAKLAVEQQKLELLRAQHQAKMESAEKDREVKLALAEFSMQEKMMEMGSKEQLTMAQLESRMAELRESTMGKEHLLAQEAKIAMGKRPEQKGL